MLAQDQARARALTHLPPTALCTCEGRPSSHLVAAFTSFTLFFPLYRCFFCFVLFCFLHFALQFNEGAPFTVEMGLQWGHEVI